MTDRAEKSIAERIIEDLRAEADRWNARSMGPGKDVEVARDMLRRYQDLRRLANRYEGWLAEQVAPTPAPDAGTEPLEQAWMAGHRAALVGQLRSVIRDLASDGARIPGEAQLVAEREECVALLRRECAERGLPSNWPDDLHLADVIEKWLLRELEDREEQIREGEE